MKHQTATPSATSLPRAPHDDSNRRMTKYFIMMAVRVVCFVLMVVIAPYGWHTAALAVGAIFLPYFAVVIANVGDDVREPAAVSPLAALPERPEESPSKPQEPAKPTVIEIRESRPE
ncbi:DUF3099 domain-containing protein [Microbacterium sp. NE2HP2]|uniref:DUF3099 domain-containing protein n=1 Tax=Microbacterium plantarum TaxID=1816425 RepID=A0ABV5ES49_9MICO|nr:MULTISPECIES: DUF3099 domain-containing protein [Microbacterium]MCZ4066775.1 DUF3099 domain-containing protein [Microbacterium sp. H37-C3]MDD7943372.1 DUF3099 domain-containing protein [Microbacterium plantarum]WHE37342.1 DUF3099 domain-containing protein [Microbacterium sp. BDGP8]WRK18521.1 DUF3099 domain-containing protein [Microbacterium plantarum]